MDSEPTANSPEKSVSIRRDPGLHRAPEHGVAADIIPTLHPLLTRIRVEQPHNVRTMGLDYRKIILLKRGGWERMFATQPPCTQVTMMCCSPFWNGIPQCTVPGLRRKKLEDCHGIRLGHIAAWVRAVIESEPPWTADKDGEADPRLPKGYYPQIMNMAVHDCFIES